jgi:hypothetical protein
MRRSSVNPCRARCCLARLGILMVVSFLNWLVGYYIAFADS